MTRITYKRIMYIPGIITLIILPLVFIYISLQEIKARTYTVIPIYFGSKTTFEKNPELFTGYGGHLPPQRNYKDIMLTGNTSENNTLLNLARLDIRQMTSINDTINGLHFTFSTHSTYGTFVKLVNTLKTENAKTFVPIDNELWVFNLQPIQKTNMATFTCLYMNDIADIEPSVSAWEKVKQHVTTAWKNGKEILVGFVVFIVAILWAKIYRI